MQMGVLFSAKYTIIDCTQANDQTDLLGASNGHFSREQGSQLNKFLRDNDGEQAIVFLDEFDNAATTVRTSLLIMTKKNEYLCGRVGRQHTDITRYVH
jgi:MoxR-like ATPase